MDIFLIIFVFTLFILSLIAFLLKDKILFTLGVRNILLRKGYAVIVIFGLMIGTAVITSSLVVGDTMNQMVESEILTTYYTTDEKIVGVKPTGEEDYFNQSIFDSIQPALTVPYIDGLSPSIRDRVAVLNLKTNLSDPSVLLLGIDFGHADNFGDFLSIDGQHITSLDNSELLMGVETAEEIDASVGDQLMIFSQNGYQIVRLTYILKSEGRAGSGLGLFVTLETAQEILKKHGLINEILISNQGGVRDGLVHTDEVKTIFGTLSLHDGLDFRLEDIKKEMLEENKQDISVFTDMFLVFGSFSIIAGVILIINIFVMLSEERKSEMGIVRAIGMKRKHLKKMYLSEGCIYAILSSLIGVSLGVGIGFLIMFIVSQIFSSFGSFNIIQYFTVTPLSLIIGFIAGFLITLCTIYLTAHRISNLNIVRAIHGIPEPQVVRGSRRMLIMGCALLVCGIMSTLIGMVASQAAPFFIGLSLSIFGLGFLGRRVIGDRWAFNIVALLIFVVWLLPSGWLPEYTGGIEMFIISGLFLVFAALLLVMFNSVQITQGVTFLLGRGKSLQAVLKTAISYSLRSKFRTGMTIAIFALIIFSITTMSMIVGILGTNIESQVKKAAGGYEIMSFSLPTSPVQDLPGELSKSGLDKRIQKAVGLSSGQVALSVASSPGETFAYTIMGVTDEFIEGNEFKFKKLLKDYTNGHDAWNALRENKNLVIIDSSVLGTELSEYGPPPLFATDIGERIQVRDIHNNTVEKTIIGILDTVLMQGIFSYETYVAEDFGFVGSTLFLFTAKQGENIENLSKSIESTFLRYGMQVIDLNNLAREALRAMNQFFILFESYMALGLVIGIAGLGIITIRSVHERRQEIGMMRALGFKRSMVLQSFLIETSFVAFLGILIGVVLGIIIGYLLWMNQFSSQGFEFMINWKPILVIALVSFSITLLSVIPASRKASRVSPAEALRYIG